MMLSDSHALSVEVDESSGSYDGSPLLRLRPHHFLCIQNYRGHGYSPAFDEKMKSVIAVLRRSSGAGIIVTHGSDDLCAACPHCRDGGCDSASPERFDALVLAHAGFKEGDTIIWKLPAGQDLSSAAGSSSDQIHTDPYGIPIMCRALLDVCCPGCSWKDLCIDILKRRTKALPCKKGVR